MYYQKSTLIKIKNKLFMLRLRNFILKYFGFIFWFFRCALYLILSPRPNQKKIFTLFYAINYLTIVTKNDIFN